MKELEKKIREYMASHKVEKITDLSPELQKEIDELVAPEIVYRGLDNVLSFLSMF